MEDFVEFVLPEDTLLQYINTCRLKNEFTDVTIKVGEEAFRAHKMILQNASPVLKAGLSKDWSNNDVYEFPEEFVESGVVEDLLNFFYIAKVTITIENAYSLCIASHFLQISSLLEATEQFLGDRVSPENIFNLLFLSDKLELETLRKNCIDCLFENYDSVFKDSKITGFTAENLKMIMHELDKQSDERGSEYKEPLFEEINTWAEHDLNNRLLYFPSLLKAIPLHELSHEFLTQVVSAKNIISDSLTCSKLVLDALRNASSAPKRSSTKKGKLYCFGGYNGAYSSASSCLDPATGEWNSLTPMPTARAYFGGAVIKNKIFLCGGQSTGNGRSLEVYDCETKTWSTLQPMPVSRDGCAAASLNGYVYLSGGPSISSVSRYCVNTNQWESVKSMLNSRYNHQLIELNDRLYAIGGNGAENIVEEYNPKTDEWRIMTNTKYRHNRLGAAAHNGKIYVCSHVGFEVYSPESNTWNTLPSLNDAEGRTLVSYNGKLVSLGGGKSEATASVFEFDASKGQWTQQKDLDVPRIYHCSFVVNC